MSEAEDVNPLLLDRQLCFALYATSRAITKVYGQLLEELGVTYPQYLVLLLLWEEDGLSIQQIANRLELEGATTTPLVQRMEKLDLITRTRSRDDERRLEVRLTPKGAVLRAKALSIPPRLTCALDVTDNQAAALVEELHKIRRSIGADQSVDTIQK